MFLFMLLMVHTFVITLHLLNLEVFGTRRLLIEAEHPSYQYRPLKSAGGEAAMEVGNKSLLKIVAVEQR